MPVIDANLVVAWLVPIDPSNPALAALDRMIADEVEMLAPPLLVSEVCNALLSGVRRGIWGGTTADKAVRHLDRLPISLQDHPKDLPRAWELARRFDNHPIYDLLYVALAERKGTTLITNDLKLRRRLVGLDYVISPEDVLA